MIRSDGVVELSQDEIHEVVEEIAMIDCDETTRTYSTPVFVETLERFLALGKRFSQLPNDLRVALRKAAEAADFTIQNDEGHLRHTLGWIVKNLGRIKSVGRDILVRLQRFCQTLKEELPSERVEVSFASL